MIIDPGIDRFITHELKSRFCNCDISTIVFGIRVMCLGFSNKSHVDIFYRIRKTVVGKVKFDTSICFKRYSKEENMEIKYSN